MVLEYDFFKWIISNTFKKNYFLQWKKPTLKENFVLSLIVQITSVGLYEKFFKAIYAGKSIADYESL